jgi:NifU-like protein involved in Fe-S cluster formation
MVTKLKSKTLPEALSLAQAFHDTLTVPSPSACPAGFEELKDFAYLRNFPQRIKCTTLCWNALKKALTKAV